MLDTESSQKKLTWHNLGFVVKTYCLFLCLFLPFLTTIDAWTRELEILQIHLLVLAPSSIFWHASRHCKAEKFLSSQMEKRGVNNLFIFCC